MDILDPRDAAPLDFIARAAQHGLSPRTARMVLSAALNDFSDLSKRRIPQLAQRACFPFPRLDLVEVNTSTRDSFQKLRFRTIDGLSLETVIIPLQKDSAVTVCLSSQVGCVMQCAFCATARMPQRRSLKTWEIVDQFIQARRVAQTGGRQITGAVFMGMGEPFLNYTNVIAAAQLLCFPVQNAIAAKAITISTVGLVQEIDRFTDDKLPFRLSISIGSAIDAKREILVPVAARTPIERVMQAARRYALSRNDRVNIAYVLCSGINTLEEDAQELARVVGDTPIRLDLIDVNDSTGRFTPPDDIERNRFLDHLRKHLGQPVVRRYSGGADIRAACGTLAGAAA